MTNETNAPATPAPSTLTAGQRAAATRAANRAAGGASPRTSTGKASTSAPRAAGLILEMWLAVRKEGTGLDISFRTVGPDGKEMNQGLASSEGALPWLRWTAFALDGELANFHLCTLTPRMTWGTAGLEMALPLMRRVDTLIARAREESEDPTVGFVAATLASHFQVGRIKNQAVDGTVTEAKRGAAYITALRLGDALLAAQPKPQAAPVPKQEPVKKAA